MMSLKVSIATAAMPRRIPTLTCSQTKTQRMTPRFRPNNVPKHNSKLLTKPFHLIKHHHQPTWFHSELIMVH